MFATISIHHFINKVGSDAGFASIIGLAILVLLYFAQARETATLREHLDEATERLRQLESRIHLLGRQPAPGPAAQPVAQRSVAEAAAGAPARGGAGPGPAEIVASRNPAMAPPPIPIAPAGVGAPALTAATKLIATPVAAAAVAEPPPPPLPPFQAERPPPPATVAAGGNGHGGRGPYDDAVVAAPPPPPPVAAPVGSAPPPRVQIRPSGGSAVRRPSAGMPRFSGPPERTGPGRRVLTAIVGIAIVVGFVIAIVSLTSSGGSSPRPAAPPISNAPQVTHHHQTSAATSPAVNPASVTVSVLNGTAQTGLARRVGVVLTNAGYRQGLEGNAPDQTHSATVVAYLPGYHADALAVAKSLKLSSALVQPVDANTQGVACGGATTSCTANVVVTVGADLSGTP
jgi:LytR cell envelope-related transcriptional attenuator